nr:MAG TPA: hypothetical protein [Caudoviricetes sp.]
MKDTEEWWLTEAGEYAMENVMKVIRGRYCT